MSDKPQLTMEQKAFLIYELMLWASLNAKIMGADSPKTNIFGLVRCIINEEASKMSCNAQQVYIQELRKSGELWLKMQPFLKNQLSGCITPISGIGESWVHTCTHEVEMHKDGKCTGTHRRWEPNGVPVPYGGYSRGPLYGAYIEDPCPCTCYRTRQTW